VLEGETESWLEVLVRKKQVKHTQKKNRSFTGPGMGILIQSYLLECV